MAMIDFFKRLGKKETKPFMPFTVVNTEKGNYGEFHNKLLNYSLIMLINGKRGSGKTALGMKFLELYNKSTKRRCYVLGYEDTRLPWWMKKVDAVEKIPNNAAALIEEVETDED